MKTNEIKIFFSIISFCFLVTSCNNLLSELTQQKTYIQISTNLDNTNQRTVLPDFSVVQENGYTWELYKHDSVLQTWNDANGKSAYQNMCESKIEVDPGNYSFELMVKKEGEIILKSESQTVTIEQNKNNELNFVLYPPTENEAKGSVNFKLTFPNEKVNIVKAYLFKPVDDGKEVAVGNMEDVAITTEGSSSTANITVTNVPAGSYLLKVDLCYQVAAYSRSETINTYTTIVQVAAGFCSEAEVTLNSLTDYYTITYEVDNEIIKTFKGGENQTTFKKNSEVPLQIACNSNNDQISIGWFYDTECTIPVVLNSDNKFTITNNITLYSQWGSEVSAEVLSFGAIDTTNNIEGLLIKTETGLNYFRNIVNGTLNENIIVSDNVVYRRGTPYPTVNAKLCSDIELTEANWVPIGNGKYEGTSYNIYYEGSFNGNGKGVTNLRITSNESSSLTESSSFGFFGSVKNATIKNLYVSGEIQITCNQNDSVGGIVGYAKDNSKIDNCVNNVIITVTESSNVGGIIGSSNNSSVSNCINVAELSGKSGAGIIGSFSNTSDEKITIDCVLNLGNLNFSNNGAGIIYIGSYNVEVSNSVNTGVISGANIYPICNNYNNNIQNSNTVTNCFYDSDRIQNVPENSFGSGKITSWFYTEDTNSEENLSDWSFAFGRYPLPSTLQSIFDDVWAKLCKAAETGITTWSALASAIENETSTQSEFVITNNLVATETIEISRPIKIIGGEVTITRGDNFKNEFFNVAESNSQSASLTIQGSDNKNIIFDSFNKTASAPFINFSKELTVSNCTFQNNTNSETDGGAIYSKGNFSATNCTFINNHTNGSNMSGGAIAVYDDATVNIKECTLKNNSSNCQNGGGALYIQKNNSSNFVNIINSSFENNGANAIYVQKGSLSLSSVTMKDNTTTINEESTTRDIYVYDIQPNGALEFDGVNSEILMNLCYGTGQNVYAKNIRISDDFSMKNNEKIAINISGTSSSGFSLATDKSYFSFDVSDENKNQLVETINNNFTFTSGNTAYALTNDGKLQEK